MWNPDWALAALHPAVGETLLTRVDLRRSSGMLLSDALARQTRVAILSAGCHGAWDLPYTVSPGTERLAIWFNGGPTAGAAIPEALLQTQTPQTLEQLLYLAPDPFLDPLSQGGDGILWARAIRLDGSVTRSAVRVTEGPTGAATEDFILGRQTSHGRWWGTYAHSRSDGRPEWIRPRYTLSRYQNLGLHVERSLRAGAFAVEAADRAGRYALEGGRKLIWQAQQVSAGWQFACDHRLTGELRVTRGNDLLQGWESGESDRRRTTSSDAVARMRVPAGRATLHLAAGVERVSLRCRLSERYQTEEARVGTGVAMGTTVQGRRGVVRATAGWVSPWWGAGHARVHLLGATPLGDLLRGELEGWVGAGFPFVPRLEGDGSALLEEGIVLPGVVEARQYPLRRVAHAEARVRARHGGQDATLGLFARRLEHAIGVDPEVAFALAPEARDVAGFDRLAGTATLEGAAVSWALELPLGGGLRGDASLILHPRRDRLPMLTPRGRGRAVLSVGGVLFDRSLRWEARLIGVWRDRWQTPYGVSPAAARWDAEIHGTMGRAHFFFALRHLGNGVQESATYVDGGWMPLPYRSGQLGVEWHFVD